jgi:hypothetical protein
MWSVVCWKPVMIGHDLSLITRTLYYVQPYLIYTWLLFFTNQFERGWVSLNKINRLQICFNWMQIKWTGILFTWSTLSLGLSFLVQMQLLMTKVQLSWTPAYRVKLTNVSRWFLLSIIQEQISRRGSSCSMKKIWPDYLTHFICISSLLLMTD